eukprot:TRINITY_DN7714_c0_g1_i1.p1 TRINITY_DN7714_c0_g1~~TRINITY_DN7714_c0_g1_i1.p1  ORF type:complete len:308 (+),score=43.11 TRINITY_DN7714_c0_g1_i1:40-924(+)
MASHVTSCPVTTTKPSATPCTLSFFEHNLVDFDQPLQSGFYDIGRHLRVLPSLAELRRVPVHSGRETILLQPTDDPVLRLKVDNFLLTLAAVADHPRARVHVLALLVSNALGGCNDDLVTNTERAVVNAKLRLESNVVPLGELQFGVCRHRAVLFKYIAGLIGLPCRLVRGDYRSAKGTEGHSWNVVRLGNRNFLCDVMHDPGALYEEGSDKAEHYKRVARVGDQFCYAGGPGMESLPLPKMYEDQSPLQSCADAERSRLQLEVRTLRREMEIRDRQMEALAAKLLELDPSAEW